MSIEQSQENLFKLCNAKDYKSAILQELENEKKDKDRRYRQIKNTKFQERWCETLNQASPIK